MYVEFLGGSHDGRVLVLEAGGKAPPLVKLAPRGPGQSAEREYYALATCELRQRGRGALRFDAYVLQKRG